MKRNKTSTEHRIHKHPLIPLKWWLALLPCDACGLRHEGRFFTCTTCIQSTSTQFFIHRDCALLPSTLKHSGHYHLLNLAHSFPPEYSQFSTACNICHRWIKPKYWVYCCGGCRYFAHVYCATSNKEKISKTDRETPKTEPFMLILEPCTKIDTTKVEDFVPNVIHLPIADQSVSLISLFLKDKEMKLEEENNRSDETTKNLDHFSHEHSLTLFNFPTEDGELCSSSQLSLMNIGIKNDERCHGCVQYIPSSPFYSCVQCKFLLHERCAELPMKLSNQCHPRHPLFLINHARPFHKLFSCNICQEYFTGLGYRCDSCKWNVDAKCSLLPSVITHEAHPQHLLVLRKTTDKNRCSACRFKFTGQFAFECNTCDYFRLHIRCALLPRTIRHRYDNLHPFMLTYSPVRDHPDEYLCEDCEREIDPNAWFYHCVVCDLSFHVSGISGCGKYSNIMFGVNIDSQHHQHSLTPLLKPTKSPPYDCCGKDVTNDSSCFASPVMECSLCNFKVHLTCLLKYPAKVTTDSELDLLVVSSSKPAV